MLPFQDLKKTNASLADRYVAAAEAVVRSGRYINGPFLERLEHEMQSLTGASRCVGTSTGLDALRLILEGYRHLGRLCDGDEVIVPANTFIATFLAVTHCGLTAVAADVDPSTANLDWKRLPLSERTRAVIPVHLYGRICWDPEVTGELRRKGILVIEDCAQAIGAENAEEGFNASRMAGNLGDAAAISFYPAKNVGAFGDAGAVLTNDDRLADTVRQLANYGAETKYRHDLCGFNCRMDEIQAALLLEKLPTIEEVSRGRRATAALYDRLITNPEVEKPRMPSQDREGECVWHQYVIRHPRRDDLRRHLAEAGVATEIHYPVACHRQPCYQGHPLLKTPTPLAQAEALADTVLSLPIADVTDAEAEYIAEKINEYHYAEQ